ncbi:MAG: type VI secretion system baseplate subunit TssF [Alphaproteobacteria bacterium]|nr:type VI secretion system baseplate subunit TssF [Alphaproteobacteria bacterium]
MLKNDIDVLSEYYQYELSYLRSAGSYFAARFPKIARRLDISHHESSDPHVERLIESFAFLSGRLQKQIDDQFPEVASELLNVLYKPLMLPVPSCVMVNFDIDVARASKAPGFVIPKGTQLSIASHSGEMCYFRTAHDLSTWPIEIVSADIVHKEHIPNYYARSVYCLKIGIKYNGIPNSKTPENLRFYIHADALLRGKIFSSIFSSDEKVIFQKDKEFEFLSQISPIGIDDNEALLPYPNNAFQGFRLLQEYFTFPEKFFGFSVDFSSSHIDINGDTFLYIPMEYDFLMKVSANNFSLSSVPAINLFPKVSEPLRMDNWKVEYCIIPDFRRYHNHEIYSIEKMVAIDVKNNDEEIIPEFFSCEHHETEKGIFWKSRRKKTYIPDAIGDDIYVSFIDINFDPQFPSDKIFYAHTLCTNRSIAEQIPVNGSLQMELSAPVNYIYCWDRPTDQKQSIKNGEILWKLISMLSLNSISFDSDGIKKLKEILYIFADLSNASLMREVDSIISVESSVKTKRISNQTWCGFVQGSCIDITFDETLSNLGLPLSLVISKFLTTYTSINTFTEVVVKNISRDEIIKKWEPNFGSKAYL